MKAHTSIFLNLGTSDLERAKRFFTGLGFGINEQFTDQNAACIVISENIFAMILLEDFFKKFTNHKDIIDAHTKTEITTALSFDSKEKVDELVGKAIAMGATENMIPEMQQDDTMYGRSFNDPDGHIWEIMWMDPKIIK